MDAIAKAISEIKFIIPREILNEVFIKRFQEFRSTPSNNIDNEILAQVIRPRVLVDCDLIGGIEMYVPLNRIPQQIVGLYSYVYNIPKAYTNNRSIMSLLEITFNDPTTLGNYGNNSTNQSSVMSQVAMGVGDAQGSIPLTETADLQLIGDNVVYVRGMLTIPTNSYLRCKIGYDSRMNHLPPGAYLAFAKACEFAIKAFIYKELIIKMGSGQLQAGQLLGPFKDEVDKFSDAEANYEDYRKQVLQKLLLMSDRESYTRLMRFGFGGFR
jgi:hypothetical protein